MMLDKIFQRFVEKRPISVMARAAIEYALTPEVLDELFERTAEQQYSKQLLLSTMVDLMSLVVTKTQPSVKTAYEAIADTMPASLTATYEKLKRIEPNVSAAFVHETAERLSCVIDEFGVSNEEWLPGFSIRIIDGNHLASTQRRLEALRTSHAGPIPGIALVVLDPITKLARHMIPCEDGHGGERSLLDDALTLVREGELWIADRNFCTFAFLRGIVERNAHFVIRYHASSALQSRSQWRARGRCSTGKVFEKTVSLTTARSKAHEPLLLRLIRVELDVPTRDGETEVLILTDLSREAADAKKIASLYLKRWTIETMFGHIAQKLRGEIDTLGYPKAALFGFAVALAIYNVFSTIESALAARFGDALPKEGLSGYKIANELRSVHEGMDVAVGEAAWNRFARMAAKDFARELLELAGHVRIERYRKSGRGPKKKPPPRTQYLNHNHISTFRVLNRSAD